MSLKSTLLMAAGMAMMGEAMMHPGHRKRFYKDSSAYSKNIQFGNYKHEGEVPKGCKLETITLFIDKHHDVDYIVQLDIDIVYGTIKARNKKIIKYASEIKEFIESKHIGELKKK